MLQLLGQQRVATSVRGDGAGSLVEALATTDPDGMLQVLVWNGTLDQTKADGEALLGRKVTVRLRGMRPGRYRQEHLRVDAVHSNVAANWASMGSPDWPDAEQWATLRERDRLDPLIAPVTVETSTGELGLEFQLPMPGISLVRLVSAGE
jgi:xylan 1,4-beta-xylosidase